ncbi:hypothetical protein [Enhygromyxa salina]|uniref:hypothetical protein n=1 Tax=Enhygromyxa salina TaxID=215803 RepID=UPI000D03F17C|nr:hypothetical protein [Enhygromyxa salina]
MREPDQLAVRDQADLAKPTPAGMTKWQKAGVGAGVAGATGLAAFGFYRLGAFMGWWGGSSLIVIDDEKRDPKKTDDTPADGGQSNSRDRAIGKPPNISGDPEGYNTQRYPHPGSVRLTMTGLGYKVEYNNETLVPNNTPHPEVTKFQNDWNRVIKGLDSGKVKFPSGSDPSKLKPFRGLLDADGIPGKNTLNAMEIAFNNSLKNLIKWSSLVGQA